MKLALIFAFMTGCGSNYVACYDSGVPVDQAVKEPADLRKPEDLAKHEDLSKREDLASLADLSECPLCNAVECATDKNSCTTEAEKEKLESCHTAAQDVPGAAHAHCHTTTPSCHC